MRPAITVSLTLLTLLTAPGCLINEDLYQERGCELDSARCDTDEPEGAAAEVDPAAANEPEPPAANAAQTDVLPNRRSASS